MAAAPNVRHTLHGTVGAGGLSTTTRRFSESSLVLSSSSSSSSSSPSSESSTAGHWSSENIDQPSAERAEQVAQQHESRKQQADEPGANASRITRSTSSARHPPAKREAPPTAVAPTPEDPFRLRPSMHPTAFTEPQPHTFPVFNPSTGAVLCFVPDATADHTSYIIDRAERAFSAWKSKTARERSQLLRRWADLITHNADYLAGVMTAEQGKPLTEARGEVTYGASFIYWFAEEAIRAYGDVHPPMAPNQRIMVWRQPVGVSACITPWNFPLAMITRKAGAALAAGCSMIVKPSAETPLTALAIAELAYQAGIPEDVLPVITASHEESVTVGKELATNPKIAKLSFTGSTAVGKQLMAMSSSSVKRVSMELGGNAPFIVFDDADVDAAVKGAIASKFRNAGQTCVCANRFFVQAGIYDKFMTKFNHEIEKLKVGDGFKPGVVVGPMINEAAVKNVTRLVVDAQKHGARILSGGMKHPLGGNYFYPTLVADVKPESRLFCEEIFGPVAAVSKFSTDEDVVTLANDTRAGLVAYFYSRDTRRIWKTAEALEYGMVGVNTGIISTEVAPFGGVKESGVGREGSKYGLKEYEELKYVLLDLGEGFDEEA